MRTASGWLANPVVTGWISLMTLLYFVAEWIVSATWRGTYSYREDFMSPLGVTFCGPAGDWPCSELYPLMNVGLLVTGLAITIVAASFLVQQVTDPGHAVLLMGSGLGLYASGIFTDEVDYTLNLTALTTFMSLGSVSTLLIAMGSTTKMTVERRGVAVIAGIVSMVGFLAFVGGQTIFGSGGAQRMAIYGILIAVIALGTAGIRTPARRGRHAAGRKLAGAAR